MTVFDTLIAGQGYGLTRVSVQMEQENGVTISSVVSPVAPFEYLRKLHALSVKMMDRFFQHVWEASFRRDFQHHGGEGGRGGREESGPAIYRSLSHGQHGSTPTHTMFTQPRASIVITDAGQPRQRFRQPIWKLVAYARTHRRWTRRMRELGFWSRIKNCSPGGLVCDVHAVAIESFAAVFWAKTCTCFCIMCCCRLAICVFTIKYYT